MTPHSTPTQPDGLPLPGLDGTNPLGFLAALGVLRVIDSSCNSPCSSKLWWTPQGGTWIAKVHVGDDPQADENKLTTTLQNFLADHATPHPARRWSTFADGSHVEIRELISGEPDAWSACIGIEPLPNTDKSKSISQLQTARKDYHVKAIENLLTGVTDEQLRRTLFSPWDYSEQLEGLTLHLDPSEDRRHAHQWNQPAGDPNRKAHGNMVAANRLALEAFPFFPTVHSGTTSQTLGFRGRSVTDTHWTWPLWEHSVNASVVGSILAMRELQEPILSRHTRQTLRARGIAAVMRSQRILVGKTPNLTPARQIA